MDKFNSLKNNQEYFFSLNFENYELVDVKSDSTFTHFEYINKLDPRYSITECSSDKSIGIQCSSDKTIGIQFSFNGKPHCDSMPAIYVFNFLKENLILVLNTFYKHGFRHKINGPTMIKYGKNRNKLENSYYIMGFYCGNKKQMHKLIKNLQLNRIDYNRYELYELLKFKSIAEYFNFNETVSTINEYILMEKLIKSSTIRARRLIK